MDGFTYYYLSMFHLHHVYFLSPLMHFTSWSGRSFTTRFPVGAAAAAAAADIHCLVLSVLPVSCFVWCLVFMFDVLSSRRPLSSWARAAVALVVSILSHLRMAQGSVRGVHYQRLLVQALARIRSHTCPHTHAATCTYMAPLV